MCIIYETTSINFFTSFFENIYIKIIKFEKSRMLLFALLRFYSTQCEIT